MSEYNAWDGTKETLQWGKKAVKRKLISGGLLRRPQEAALQLGAAATRYRPLLGPSWIRLLKIEPGPVGSVIKCSLRHVDLDWKPNYTALSYTWKRNPSPVGVTYRMFKAMAADAFMIDDFDNMKIQFPEDQRESGRYRVIICNGWPTKIQPNLYAALIQFRQHRHGELWIDALCINQADDLERTAQVQMMGRIYQLAETVLVWLGRCHTWCLDGLPHLEQLATQDIQLPPWSSMLALNSDDIPIKVVLPPGVATTAEAVTKASITSLSIASAQWFRRVWVVQELCWARNVVYIMGEVEISSKALLKAFTLIDGLAQVILDSDGSISTEDPDSSEDLPDEDFFMWSIPHGACLFLRFIFERANQFIYQASASWDKCRRQKKRLTIDINQIRKTLQARNQFQNGNLWTVSEWLQACRGRKATDGRDFVFAGCSLIHPELLSIDQHLLSPKVVARGTGPPAALFARRKYYPQTMLPQGQRRVERPPMPGIPDHGTDTTSLLPNGLWQSLKPDYSVSPVETFVNVAGCLLSHTSITELLRLSARTSRPDKYQSNWIMAVDDSFDVAGVPSWAPFPGTWTSNIDSTIASWQGVSATANPVRDAELDRPEVMITQDGAGLVLKARTVDIVHDLILESGSFQDLTMAQLQNVLSCIADSPSPEYSGTFETLVRVILHDAVQEDPDNYQKAARWLGQSLTMAMAHHLRKKRMHQFSHRAQRSDMPELNSEQFQDRRVREERETNLKLDRFIAAFDAASKHWEHVTSSRLTARAWDRLIHRTYLESLKFSMTKCCCVSCGRELLDNHWHCDTCGEGGYDLCTTCHDAGKYCRNSGHHMTERHAEDRMPLTPEGKGSKSMVQQTVSEDAKRDRPGMIRRWRDYFLKVKEPSENSLSQLEEMAREIFSNNQGSSSLQSAAKHTFTETARSTLQWRKVFVTRGGHIVLAPEWAEEGDTIMLVQGSVTPFIFISMKGELQAQERALRAALDKNDAEYYDWHFASAEDYEYYERIRKRELERMQKMDEVDQEGVTEAYTSDKRSDEEEDVITQDASDNEQHPKTEQIQAQSHQGSSWSRQVGFFVGQGISKAKGAIGKQANHALESINTRTSRLGDDIGNIGLYIAGPLGTKAASLASGAKYRLPKADRTRADLQQKLAKVLNSTLPLDAWVLKGEAYVPGLMGEGGEKYMEDTKFEQILIV